MVHCKHHWKKSIPFDSKLVGHGIGMGIQQTKKKCPKFRNMPAQFLGWSVVTQYDDTNSKNKHISCQSSTLSENTTQGMMVSGQSMSLYVLVIE